MPPQVSGWVGSGLGKLPPDSEPVTTLVPASSHLLVLNQHAKD